MQQNAYLLAKIGADTAENERNFAEMLPKNCNYPTGPAAAVPAPAPAAALPGGRGPALAVLAAVPHERTARTEPRTP